MNRSMVILVGVFIVLGIIVAFNIARDDETRPTGAIPGAVAGQSGSDRVLLNQGGRMRAKAPVDTSAIDPKRAVVSEPRPKASDPPHRGESTPAPEKPDPRWALPLEVCRKRIANGEVGPALREMGHRYRNSKDAAARSFWRGPLLAWAASYLHEASAGSGMYSVYKLRRGDSLIRIAARQRKKEKVLVDAGFLEYVNHIRNPNSIRAGRRIWVPDVNPSAVVTLSEFCLDFYLGDCLFASFPVGIGKDNATPVTSFKVGDKLKEPDWYFDGRIIPYRHPDNELGERWIGFEHKTHERFGIHGTNNETTIGKAVSRGCIRLKNRDVVKLFPWVPKGMSVVVRR
jgi:hypothetical protein